MDQEKVAALVEENMKTLFAYALSRTSHREDAEDLAGDIILAILSSAPRIRDDNAFFGYIWAIAANTYRKYLYKKSRLHHAELSDETADETDFIQDILHSEQLNTLRRELALLSREYRECTLLYYFQGLSCTETASRLHISLEMVKYYLFKTRKILKEGISMEREFGVKSYQPAKFEFHAVFSDIANMEYQNLFNRKLPGNILLSTYYTPATVRQLAIELGVASVYLEDEIAVLLKYGLLTELPGGRYQARLVIFTESYMNEFYRTAEQSLTPEVGTILLNMVKKLPRLRSLRFAGFGLDDNSLLWSFLFEMMRRGWKLFGENRKEIWEKGETFKRNREGKPYNERNLYRGLNGICFGKAYESTEECIYEASSFAGYCPVKGPYAASYADYPILPAKKRYTAHADNIAANLDDVLARNADAVIPIVSADQKEAIMEILQDEISSFARLYEKLYDCSLSIMRTHAPGNLAAPCYTESVQSMENVQSREHARSNEQIIGSVLADVLLFQAVGLIGVCAVRSGILDIPEDGRPLGGFLYCTE